MSHEKILLIADAQRQLEPVLAQAAPAAAVTCVPNYFEALAELSCGGYTAVLASAEPIERRPEPAVRMLRRMAADARVVLFGHPTLEPLSRKMLDFGCDDYLITPPSPGELSQVLQTPRMRIAPADPGPALIESEPNPAPRHDALAELSLAELFLTALHREPHRAVAEALRLLNAQIGPDLTVAYAVPAAAPATPEGRIALSQPVHAETTAVAGTLHLFVPATHDQRSARNFLTRLAEVVGRLQALQDRHRGLETLAMTDELTGLRNARYFKHFLASVLERARKEFFSVTLLIFDIDNFKQYNDAYGHGVGDDILRQTASLMKRCVRDHDLVARLGGDEFAVVFWGKEGPRQPRDSSVAAGASKPPQTPQLVLERFKKLLATQEFKGLGPAGVGQLTISAGLAVFPWQAKSMQDLIELADRALMFGAKRAGKNSIFLVGGEELPLPPATNP
jgi:GGDEF domain-containing protein